MILQALSDYYDRAPNLSPPGWERKRIPFIIEISRDGRFVQLTSMRVGNRPSDVVEQLVPISEVRSGTKAYEKPNLLWDHIGFVLGHPKSDDEHDKRSAERQLTHFRRRIEELSLLTPESAGLKAVQTFYATDQYLRVLSDPAWKECVAIPGCNVTFRLAESPELVVHEQEIRAAIEKSLSEQPSGLTIGTCLVTGCTEPIERLHPPISNVGEKPAPLAAINDGSLPAFASFGKHQGENFPVGVSAAFKYSTALNHLLRNGSPQKLRIGNTIALFWAQIEDEVLEPWLAEIIGGDDPDAHSGKVKALFEAVRTGGFSGERGQNRFFVLGLAPNAARISVRFWHAAPLEEIAERVTDWFDDLRIVRSPNDMEYPSLFRLLTTIAIQGKADNIPPRLGGDIVRSIFTGSPYPTIWLNAAVQRCRAEQRVSYLRAAAIKACLNRFDRDRDHSPNHPTREITEMLDPENPSVAYRLGRLFATLEKIQEEASPGLNATIRERYYGAASSTPIAVFTTLMRLKNHHLAKLSNKGRAVNFEKLLAEIMSGIDDFPRHMPLQDQGRFAIGYYHQRQDFFAPYAPSHHENTQPDVTEPEGDL